MITNISFDHKERFRKIKIELVSIGSKEGNFFKVELLFFEAITIAREYGSHLDKNDLLASLKYLQAGTYLQANERFKKSSQREQVIRSFSNQLRIVLSTAIKNSYIITDPEKPAPAPGNDKFIQ